MKYLLILVTITCLVSLACSKTKEYRDPTKEARLSVAFTVPPSLGSPYKVGDPFFIYLIMAANKVAVKHVDISFFDANTHLSTVGIDSISSMVVPNSVLWPTLYTTAMMDTIPSSWSKKTITVMAAANGISAKDSFQVK